MKIESWLIIVALLLLAALGGLAGMHTVRSSVIEAQQAEIAAQEWAIAVLDSQIEAMQPPPYAHPLDQIRVSSGTGYRTDPMGGGGEGLHKGVDLVGKKGDPVRAVRAGQVIEHWPPPDGYYTGDPVYGGKVVIDHGDGLYSLYGHLSATCVHEGWRVEAGQVIGELGDTGIATGVHLHFEVVVDPLKYLEVTR